MISYNGKVVLKFNPMGDILTLLAAFFWALYSILSKKISQFGYHTVQSTRKVFSYGLLFMIPAFFLFRIPWQPERLLEPINTGNILFLGLGASAMCFVTWNLAVRELGAVKTSTYIYLVPVVTVITSVMVLKEQITWMSAVGMALALAGLFISEKKEFKLPHRCSGEKSQ